MTKKDLEAHLKGTDDKEGEDHIFKEGTSKLVSFPATVTYEGNNMTLTLDSFEISRAHGM